MSEQNQIPANTSKPVAPRRGKWIRRLIKGAVVLIVLVIGLIALAPTLLGTGPGRSAVLGIVNKKLNGRVDVSDWSLGWFSGVHITGLKVSDPAGKQLASVDTISIPMPLWHALAGKYPIGDAQVDGVSFDAVVDPEGVLNFSKLTKPETSAPAPSATPAPSTPNPTPAPSAAKVSTGFSIPPVFGRLTISHVHGTLARPNQPLMTVQSFNAVATLPENDGAVVGKVDAVIQTGSQPPTAIAVDLDQAIKRGTTVDLGAGKLAASIKSAGDPGDSLAVVLTTTPINGGAIQFQLDKCGGDLIRLNKQFAFLPAGQVISTGSFTVAATGTFDPATSAVTITPLDAGLNDLTVDHTDAAGKSSPVVEHWTLKTHLEGSGSFGTVVAATIKNLNVADSQNIFSVGSTDLALTRSTAGVFSGPGGAINIVADLPKLDALLKKFQSQPTKSTTPETTPTTIESGKLATTIKLVPEPTRLHVIIDGAIRQLIVGAPSGKTPVEDIPIAVDLGASADFNTIDLAKATITSHAAAVSVENLSVVLNAKTTLEKIVKGTIKIDIPELKTATTELALFSQPAAATPPPAPAKPGEAPAEPLLYDAGSVTASIDLGHSGTAADVTLNVDGKNIAFHRGTVAETLEPLAVNAHLLLTPIAADDYDLVIKTLTAGLESAKVSIADGSVGHLMTTRDMKLSANLIYNLDKLFTEFKPMLGTSLQTMEIAGVSTKTFVVGGSYPANKPFDEAVKPLTVDGGLAVDSLDYDGVKTDKPFEVWFNVRGGVLATNKFDKAAPDAADPISANSGKIHVDHLLIDLTGTAMRLTTPANFVFIEHFTINPLFSDTFLADYLNNPLFVGTKDATGLLFVTFRSCNRLPLGDLVKKTTPDNDGSADVLVSILELHLGIANDKIKDLLKESSFVGNVKDATFGFSHGVLAEHIAFSTGAYSLPFDGAVRLSDQSLMPLVLTVPTNWIAKAHITKDQNVLKLVPAGLQVPMKGTVSHPQFDFDWKKVIGNGLLGGKKPEDAAGDLLNGLLKKSEKKK